MNDVKEQYKEKKLDREGLERIHKHLEERRRDKVRILLEVDHSAIRNKLSDILLLCMIGERSAH